MKIQQNKGLQRSHQAGAPDGLWASPRRVRKIRPAPRSPREGRWARQTGRGARVPARTHAWMSGRSLRRRRRAAARDVPDGNPRISPELLSRVFFAESANLSRRRLDLYIVFVVVQGFLRPACRPLVCAVRGVGAGGAGGAGTNVYITCRVIIIRFPSWWTLIRPISNIGSKYRRILRRQFPMFVYNSRGAAQPLA